MKLNQTVTQEKLFGKKVFSGKEELWSAIVAHSKKNTEFWRNLLHWTQRGHGVITDNEYIKYAFEKAGIQNVTLQIVTELKVHAPLGKPVYCKECKKLFISTGEDTCEPCVELSKKNDDPFLVAMQNIEVMLADLHTITNKHQHYNARRELAWVLNKAYHRGYIGEEYYMSTCELIRATANLDREYNGLGKSYYDTSNFAKEGFYYDTMFESEEEQ